MFVYERKVSFIGYYINGIRSGSIGVVRQKVTEDALWLKIEWCGNINCQNKPQRIGIADVAGREIIKDLPCNSTYNSGDLKIAIKELDPEKSRKIIFYFRDGCYGIADLCCIPCVGRDDSNPDMEAKKTKEPSVEEISEPESAENAVEEDEFKSTENFCQEDKIEKETIQTGEQGEAMVECLENPTDKWEAIKRKYPILYPFKGQGPYVSIKPVDLQLLSPKYHGLADNSYLMHGFYRYRHMILGEYSMEKGTFFYVGVPGEFVKKEQTSAAMFGFEGYEHSGDLGYYLYRVEL